MKRTYFKPELTVEFEETEQIIALSLQGGNADNSDGLSRGAGEWDGSWGGDGYSDEE